MARIVLGMGSSHTPLLTMTADEWQHRAAFDYANKELNMSDGRLLTYEQVLAELGPRAKDLISSEILQSKEKACCEALDRLGDELERAAPDVVIIVGDDQRELFGPANQPSIAVYHGEKVTMWDKYGAEGSPQWVKNMGKGYWMDAAHELPCASEMALELIHGLMKESFDVATCSSVEDPHKAAFGHAYGFIVKRLFRGRVIPIVPLLLNTYYPPNVPTSRRCHDLGQAMAKVIESSPSNLRVAVIASGGLSHFVVDEELDHLVLDAFASGDHGALRTLPQGALNSGSSEILNWIVAAGAAMKLPMRWKEYQPLFRTAAGTGVGAAFVAWGND